MFVIATYAPICDCLKPTNQYSKYSQKKGYLAHMVTSSCFSSYITSYIPTTSFMVFNVTCIIGVTYPILRRMLGSTNDQQPHH